MPAGPATAAELAANPTDRIKVLAETRGEGGFVVLAPSGGRTHPSGKPWQVVSGGPDTIATVTVEERRRCSTCSGRSTRCPARQPSPPAPVRPRRRVGPVTISRTGQMGGHLGTARLAGRCRGRRVQHWCRPGKTAGTSATTGYGQPMVSSTCSRRAPTSTPSGPTASLRRTRCSTTGATTGPPHGPRGRGLRHAERLDQADAERRRMDGPLSSVATGQPTDVPSRCLTASAGRVRPCPGGRYQDADRPLWVGGAWDGGRMCRRAGPGRALAWLGRADKPVYRARAGARVTQSQALSVDAANRLTKPRNSYGTPTARRFDRPRSSGTSERAPRGAAKRRQRGAGIAPRWPRPSTQPRRPKKSRCPQHPPGE